MSGGQLRVGFLLNPVAGLGAGVALKGSDGEARQSEAQRRGGQPRARPRARDFLKQLVTAPHTRILDSNQPAAARPLDAISWYSWRGLGAELLQAEGITCDALGESDPPTTSSDTQRCVRAFVDAGVDLILFVGGDGTAVDLHAVLPPEQLVLGIPAGVKMHSGVFAVSPQAGAEVLARLVRGELVAAAEADVVDFASESDSGGAIRTRVYGQVRVPQVAGFIQHTKEGGRESEPLALAEISADIVERCNASETLVLGPGGTLHAVKQALGMTAPTLRGFDMRTADGRWQHDLQASALEPVAAGARVILSFTRHQGFLLGRGNMELSARFLADLPVQALEVVATRSKVLSLAGRPLLVDCGSSALDAKFSGLVEVVSGYEDRLLYRVQAASGELT